MTRSHSAGSDLTVARHVGRFLSLVPRMRLVAVAVCLFFAPALALRAQSVSSLEPEPADVRTESGARLLAVLPVEIAQRVLRLASDARSHRLPGAAIESAALEMRAKGASPKLVERRVMLFARMLADAQAAMTMASDTAPSDAEITAAAAALARGVTSAALRDFVELAPRDRSLALPLFVVSSLVDRGLTPRDALGRVGMAMSAHATDEELLALPDELIGLPVPVFAGQGAADRWRSLGSAGRTGPVPAVVVAPTTGALGSSAP